MSKYPNIRNRKLIRKITGLCLAFGAFLGLFSIYNPIPPVQSQTPTTTTTTLPPVTPTSLRLAVKRIDLSPFGDAGTYQPVLEVPHVTGKATSATNTTLNDTNQSFTANQFVNFLVEITGGTGQGQVRLITSNTSSKDNTSPNQLTVSPPWTTGQIPDNTSTYEIKPTFSGKVTAASNGPPPTLDDTNQSFTPGQFANNSLVEITAGTASGQVRLITDNTDKQLTVSPAWTIGQIPDNTSTYLIRPTVDVIKNNGSAFNAGNLLFSQGTYKGIQITVPEFGSYSGPDPCNPGNTLNNVPIQIPEAVNGEVVFSYVYVPPLVIIPLPPHPHFLQLPMTIGSNPVELRLVFRASNSVTCASDGLTAQLGTSPMLISSDETQSALFPESLFAESLYVQYFYSGTIDKSQVTGCISPCNTTGDTSSIKFNGYDFTWRLVRTTPQLPFSDPHLADNASLESPGDLTLIGVNNPTKTVPLGCNVLLPGQGPPLDLITIGLSTDCSPPHIVSPVPAPNGKYNVPHTLKTQPQLTFVTSIFPFSSTPLLESQFPRPVPTITAHNDGTNRYQIDHIDWIFSTGNPKPIIFSQQVQIFVNLPCDPTGAGCDVTSLFSGYKSAGGGVSTALRNRIFPDPNPIIATSQAPQAVSTTLTVDVAANDTTIPVASAGTDFFAFPTSGTIQIENEEISYTGIGATVADCSFLIPPCFTGAARGANGTTPAPHSIGALVTSVTGNQPHFILTNVTNTNQPIYLNDVKTIRYTIGDALGTTFTFDFQATGPDLVETTLQPSTVIVGLGKTYPVTDTVQNQGTATAGSPTTTNYYLKSTSVNLQVTVGSRTVQALSVTTLTADVAANSTADIPVTDTTGFPTSGVIRIENEDISYTNVTSTSFTGVTRGVNGTTAGAHSSGTSVGAMDTGTGSISIPSNIGTGDYSLLACADEADPRFPQNPGLVLESNEQNNCITAPITVQ